MTTGSTSPPGCLKRILLSAGLLTALSAILYLFNLPAGGKFQFELVGESPVRLAGSLVLLFLTIAFFFCVVVLNKNPGLDEKLSARFTGSLQVGWIKGVLTFVTLALLLIALLLLLDILLAGDQRFAQFWLRVLPFWLLALGYPLIVLSGPFLQQDRRKLVLILAFSLLVLAITILQDDFLSRSLAHPVRFLFYDLLGYQISVVLLALLFALVFFGLPDAGRVALGLAALLTAGMFWQQWALWPRKLVEFTPVVAANASYFMLGLPLLALGLYHLGQAVRSKTSKNQVRLVKGLVILGMIALGYVYYTAAAGHAEKVNTSTSFTDQGSYIKIIKEARQTNFRTTGDQNRMPGYPFFQALFYPQGMDDLSLFEQGKTVNIILSLFILAGLFLVFLRYLPFLQASLLVIILEFTLFLFKAPYLQSEIAFYFFSFICYLCFLHMIQRPTWKLALGGGAIAALAYLTKGTVLLGIPIFILVYLVKVFLQSISQRRSAGAWPVKEMLIKSLYLAVFLLVFLALAFPYLRSMKQRFGRYFYNVNTTVYIWLDSWDQAVAYEDRYHFAERWPEELSGEQIPGALNYLQTHSGAEIARRMLAGFGNVYRNMLYQYSIINYPLVYLAALGLAVLIARSEAGELIKRHPYLIGFAICYYLAYLAAFSWYAPIGGGRRFAYTLQIPLLFSIFASINTLARKQIQPGPTLPAAGQAGSVKQFFSLANLVVSLTLIYITWLMIEYVLYFDRYGS